MRPRTWIPALLVHCLLLLCLAACGGEPAAPAAAAPVVEPPVPARLEVEVPPIERKVRGPYTIEALTDAVAGELSRFADKVFVRDFDGAAGALTPDFVGHDLFGPASGPGTSLPLGAERTELAPSSLEGLRRGPWVEAMAARCGPWRRVDLAHVRVRAADFERSRGGGPVTLGRAVLHTHVVGITPQGARVSIERDAEVLVRRKDAQDAWRIDRLRVTHGADLVRDAAGFTDVSRSTGVAHEGIRYGRPGNDSDGWNGLAVGDVDGDGRFDLFVPGSTRNFLYRATGEGTFVEEAAARGLAGPGGGTGALFLDHDHDGDLDLFVAHIGWGRPTVNPGGETPRAYRNDGEGRFVDVTAELGLDRIRHATYALTAFDADGDGWVDLFLVGYGRMGEGRNDSWREARNGEPDRLLRNEAGGRFADVTEASGIEDESWGYSAAAADIDRDGDQDLVVANTFGTTRLWRNRGDGTFEDAGQELGVTRRGMSVGARFGDVTGDGRLDLFLTGSHSPTAVRTFTNLQAAPGHQEELAGLSDGNVLYRGLDGGRFERIPQALGAAQAGWAWGSALADVDLDGRLDVIAANGFVTGDIAADT